MSKSNEFEFRRIHEQKVARQIHRRNHPNRRRPDKAHIEERREKSKYIERVEKYERKRTVEQINEA